MGPAEPRKRKMTSWRAAPGVSVLLGLTAVFSGLACSGEVRSSAEPIPVDGRPPPPPASGSQGDGPGTVLAVSRFWFGDTDADGTPDQQAWRHFGYNIDGLVSPQSPGHCRARDGGSKAAIETDGDHGVDNSFGYNIVPVLAGLDASFSDKMNRRLADGAYTLILAVEGVDTGADYVGLRAAIYEGGQLGHAAVWDGSDEWPVFCEYLNTCLAEGTPSPPANPSAMVFPASYVNDQVWVSGAPGDVTLAFDRLGQMAPLRLHSAIISLRLGNEDPAPQSGIQGIISGVIDTDEFIADLQRLSHLAGAPITCDDWWGGAAQLEAVSDIMRDGTQDPGATCDGISVGIGFEAKAVRLGPALNKQPIEPDPCVQ